MAIPKRFPFTVCVEAAFDESGVWLIDARLRFHHGPPRAGSELLGQGRLALLHGIAREGLHGRSLGAEKVRVHLDIDGTHRDIDLADGLAGPDSLN